MAGVHRLLLFMAVLLLSNGLFSEGISRRLTKRGRDPAYGDRMRESTLPRSRDGSAVQAGYRLDRLIGIRRRIR